MDRVCKECGGCFDAQRRADYCSQRCRTIARTRAKRHWRRVVQEVRGNLDDYAEGIEDYNATRGDPRYAVSADVIEDAPNWQDRSGRLALANDDSRRRRTRTAAAAAAGFPRKQRNWGGILPQCSLVVNGAGPVKGHCRKCNRAFEEQLRQEPEFKISLPHQPSYVWNDSKIDSAWKINPSREHRAVTKADIDTIGDGHSTNCHCEVCRAEQEVPI